MSALKLPKSILNLLFETSNIIFLNLKCNMIIRYFASKLKKALFNCG